MDIAAIAFKADTTDLKKANKEIDNVAKAGKKAETASQKISKSFFDMSAVSRKLAISLGGATVAITALFAVVAKDSLALASDLEETQGKFDVVFRGMGTTAENWSRRLVESYAMSEQESKQYLSSIQDLIVPTGLARDEAGSLSNKFVQLAADLGSFNNLPTSKVIEDIQSALAGGSETLTKYGINIKVAQVKQEALNMGIIKEGEVLTRAKRVRALYNIMLRESSDAFGDMARTSGSYANQMKQMEARLTDIKATIGKALLPQVTKLETEFNDWYRINEFVIKQDITDFIESIGVAAKTAGGMVHRMSNSVKLLSLSVASDQVSIWDWVTADAEDAQVLLNQARSGLLSLQELRGKALRDQEEVDRKLRGNNSSFMGGLSEKELSSLETRNKLNEINIKYYDEQISLAKEQMVIAGEQVSSKEALVIEADKYKKKIEKNNEAEVDNTDSTSSKIIDIKAEEFKKVNDLREQNVANTESLEEELNNEIKRMSLSSADYERYLLDEQVKDWKNRYDEKGQLTDKFASYYKLRLQEISDSNKDATDDMASAWENAMTTIEDEAGDVLGDVIYGDINSLGDAWDAFADGMKSSWSTTLGEMVAEWGTSGMESLLNSDWGSSGDSGGLWDTVTSWFGYNKGGYVGMADGGLLEGGTGLKDDIYGGSINGKNFLLQGGEFIVNEEIASKNRNFLEALNRGEFERMAEGGSASNGTSTMLYQFGGGTTINDSLDGLSTATQNQTKEAESNTNSISENTTTTNTSTSASISNTEATDDATKATEGLAKETEATSESMNEAAEGVKDFSVSLTATQKTISNVIGAFNATAGMATKAAMTGYNAVNNGLAAAAWGDAMDSRNNEGFRDDLEALGYGYKYSMMDMNDKENVDKLKADISSWSSQTSGQGSKDTGSGSGVGDTGGGTPGHDPGGSFGMAGGGIVDTVFVPNGDDGLQALSLGEGVIDKDTMNVLSKQIKMGGFGNKNLVDAINSLISTLTSSQGQIAFNSNKSRKTLNRLDRLGVKTRT